ncbi:J domain-containing protein [Gemmata sp. G18]|uniref:J domain-containing protein n=1 Tax=Gemmata palustris TaxID=2822762 RepID=A0ABS5BMC3_9BACT|nr:J domain-containing protein [Gemmata palustris]MBP3954851.1 J domain-containing protein [Gemmata palustris]
MNKLNRALRGMSSVKFTGLLMLGPIVACAGTANPFVGLVGVAAFGLLLYRSMTNPSSGWAPNVRGENPYQILGVTQGADAATIRRAFRELERAHHPDAVPEDRKADATALFIRINQAYELLSDPEKRYEYDHLLEMYDGVIPPFDEAFRQIKDVDKHEMYAVFDELHPPEPTVPPEIPAPPAPLPGPVVAEPPAPVEVELPDSVREALGLLPRPDPPGSGSIEDRPG